MIRLVIAASFLRTWTLQTLTLKVFLYMYAMFFLPSCWGGILEMALSYYLFRCTCSAKINDKKLKHNDSNFTKAPQQSFFSRESNFPLISTQIVFPLKAFFKVQIKLSALGIHTLLSLPSLYSKPTVRWRAPFSVPHLCFIESEIGTQTYVP